jgi:hypothetical protein
MAEPILPPCKHGIPPFKLCAWCCLEIWREPKAQRPVGETRDEEYDGAAEADGSLEAQDIEEAAKELEER